MNVRPMEPKDLPDIELIHSKYFSDEFALPDFSDKFLCKFVIEDDDGEIICAAGVRVIAESIMITDQDITAREKRNSLMQALNASIYMSGKNGFDHLHVFAQGDVWNNILKKVGFRNCKGNALVINCR